MEPFKGIVFLNQSFIPEDEAVIPVSDRGFLFGDGVFTTIKVYNGVIEGYQMHEKRLHEHCQSLNIIPPAIHREWIKELIVQNHAQKGIWRLKIIITGGNASSLNCEKRNCGQLLITLKPYMREFPEELHLTVYPQGVVKPLSHIKGLAYIDRLWIRQYALSREASECLVLDDRGFVLETAFSNLFWRLGSEIFTPDFSLPLLKGIAIQMVQKTAEALGIPFHPIYKKLEEIPKNAQLFTCNSLKGICPITAIEKQQFTRDEAWEKSFYLDYLKQVRLHSLFLAF